VFVDVDEHTQNIDPKKLRHFFEHKCRFNDSTNTLFNELTNRPIRAIIPVHLYGQPADMDPVLDVARKHNLMVVEDACQAHGAKYNGTFAGTIGDAGCFSFYPGKNLGAYGEAGAVVTDNAELAEKLKMFRDHGQAKKYHHSMVGWNARMDGFQGAVLSVKLKYLHEWNKARRKNAKTYNKLLADIAEVETPVEIDGNVPVYHLYVIQTDNRDGLQQYLTENGIGTGLHYPIPLHLQPAYAHLGYKEGDFPAAERAAKRILSLPMYPELSEKQIQYVCKKILEYYSSNK
jgi:dTDP-4-amino-4,6-dideoxygalactose transaminase